MITLVVIPSSADTTSSDGKNSITAAATAAAVSPASGPPAAIPRACVLVSAPLPSSVCHPVSAFASYAPLLKLVVVGATFIPEIVI